MMIYLFDGGHIGFYASWPPGGQYKLFAMVFDIKMPIGAYKCTIFINSLCAIYSRYFI